jgi:hypothetical protein
MARRIEMVIGGAIAILALAADHFQLISPFSVSSWVAGFDMPAILTMAIVVAFYVSLAGLLIDLVKKVFRKLVRQI